jgi:fructose-bisphosphate aldolase class 1
VPIVEPEVLMDGDHTLARCAEVTERTLPWPLAFSFARAIQDPAMKAWAGKPENVAAAQKALVERANLNRLARRGQYTAAMEAPR